MATTTERGATRMEEQAAELIMQNGAHLDRFDRPADDAEPDAYVMVLGRLSTGWWLVADWYGGHANECLAYWDEAEARAEFARRRAVECLDSGLRLDEFDVMAEKLRRQLASMQRVGVEAYLADVRPCQEGPVA